MMRVSMRSFFFLLLMVTFFYGCEDTTTEPFVYSFDTDNLETFDNSVTLALQSVTDDMVFINVLANSITNGNVHGAYFDLTYEDAYLRFAGYKAGNFLENGGTVTYQVGLDSADPDSIVCAASLLGHDTAVSGSGTIMTIKFERVLSGTTRFVFMNNHLRDNSFPDGNIITGISWYGATLRITE